MSDRELYDIGIRRGEIEYVPGLVPGIRVLMSGRQERRGWPGIGERKRRRPSDG
jgi:Domain of unknown function (DUF1127)